MEPSEDGHQGFPGKGPEPAGIELVDQHSKQEDRNGENEQAPEQRRTAPAESFHDVERDE